MHLGGAISGPPPAQLRKRGLVAGRCFPRQPVSIIHNDLQRGNHRPMSGPSPCQIAAGDSSMAQLSIANQARREAQGVWSGDIRVSRYDPEHLTRPRRICLALRDRDNHPIFYCIVLYLESAVTGFVILEWRGGNQGALISLDKLPRCESHPPAPGPITAVERDAGGCAWGASQRLAAERRDLHETRDAKHAEQPHHKAQRPWTCSSAGPLAGVHAVDLHLLTFATKCVAPWCCSSGPIEIPERCRRYCYCVHGPVPHLFHSSCPLR